MSRQGDILKFNRMLIELLMYAVSEDIPFQGGEWHRSQEEAARLAVAGKGIANSKHCRSLAVDLWILDPLGNPVFDRNSPFWPEAEIMYNRLGQKWKELGGRWGGTFTRYNDVFHFEFDDTININQAA